MPVYRELPDADITCPDYSPDMMKAAQERTKALNLSKVRFQQGDVGALPYADGSFDIALSLRQAEPVSGSGWRACIQRRRYPAWKASPRSGV